MSCPGGEHSADLLDTILYNGVAAAIAQDGRSVQPIQQANQTAITRESRFPLSGENANLYTLEDGEALAALLAAWPRFAQHQWLASRDEGIFALSYAPCQVRSRLGGAAVRLTVDSRYPASGAVRISLSLDRDAAFPIHLRIPAWAEGATAAVAGEITAAEVGRILTLNRQWHDGDEILLTLPMTAKLEDAFHEAAYVTRGPLVFVYAPKYDRAEDDRGGFELRARKGFGMALVESAPLEVVENKSGALINARAIPVPRWSMRGASCDQPPITLPDAGSESALYVTLVPYASAPIRLAVMPLA